MEGMHAMEGIGTCEDTPNPTRYDLKNKKSGGNRKGGVPCYTNFE